jgi:hypothetical protein
MIYGEVALGGISFAPTISSQSDVFLNLDAGLVAFFKLSSELDLYKYNIYGESEPKI